jgi:hypothetical protein
MVRRENACRSSRPAGRAAVMALEYTEITREFGHLLPLGRRLALAARIGFYKISSVPK